MALQFNPTTGITADSTADIRASVQQQWIAAFAKDGLPELSVEPETPQGQLIDSLTAIIADKDAQLLFLANQFNPLTASGVWQAALGQIYFIEPFAASQSVATCTCTGMQGTQIPAGAIIKSSSDNSLWTCLSTVTIPAAGSIDVQFQCQTFGPIVAGAGVLDTIVTVTPGWDAVINPAAAVVGTNAETQRAFELRRYNSVAANARGSVSAIFGALSQVEGVIDLAVLENSSTETQTIQGIAIPPHSICVSIVGGADSDIAETLYRKKDVGCGTFGNTQITYTDTSIPFSPTYIYYINRPAALPFGVQVTIKTSATTPADVETLIKQAVLADFGGQLSNNRVGTAQTVYSSRFYNAVLGTGVSDLVSILIKAPIESGDWVTAIDVTADQEPTLDIDDIVIVIVS